MTDELYASGSNLGKLPDAVAGSKSRNPKKGCQKILAIFLKTP